MSRVARKATKPFWPLNILWCGHIFFWNHCITKNSFERFKKYLATYFQRHFLTSTSSWQPSLNPHLMIFIPAKLKSTDEMNIYLRHGGYIIHSKSFVGAYPDTYSSLRKSTDSLTHECVTVDRVVRLSRLFHSAYESIIQSPQKPAINKPGDHSWSDKT